MASAPPSSGALQVAAGALGAADGGGTASKALSRELSVGIYPPSKRAVIRTPQPPKKGFLDLKPLAVLKSDGIPDDAISEAPSAQTSTSSVVVADPCALRRIPGHVLLEDDYNEAVSALIERDFFPDLPQMRVKGELLKALNAGDEGYARALEWKLGHMQRPTPLSSAASTPQLPALTPPAGARTPELSSAWAATPEPAAQGRFDGEPGAFGAGPAAVGKRGRPRLSEWETDDDASSVAAEEEQHPLRKRLKTTSGKEICVDLSKVRLDDFQRVFTSEDNASFEKILQNDMALKRAKQWWIEAAEKKHNTEHKKVMKALSNGDLQSNGRIVSNEFKARNALCFHQDRLPSEIIPKPRVDVKNTRFTTDQQLELDAMLGASFAARHARLEGDKVENAYNEMARQGKFSDLQSFMKAVQVKELRGIGTRLESPGGAARACGYKGEAYGMLHTPSFLPDDADFSPMMTYGKVASTPKCLEEPGPKFHMSAVSTREEAAERLQRSALQKSREKNVSKSERLRALGITSTPGTPARSVKSATPASSARPTPLSLSGRVTPMSPIGALIHRAQKLAQQGGQLGINSTSGASSHQASTTRSSASASGHRARSRSLSQGSRAGLPSSLTSGLL